MRMGKNKTEIGKKIVNNRKERKRIEEKCVGKLWNASRNGNGYANEEEISISIVNWLIIVQIPAILVLGKKLIRQDELD